MLLAYSWLSRWKFRSAPERSTCTGMPGYFASKALATRSASSSSTEVYQTILPSFLAASMSSGFSLAGAGACASAAPPMTSAATSVSPWANLMRMLCVLPAIFGAHGSATMPESLVARPHMRQIAGVEFLDKPCRPRHHARRDKNREFGRRGDDKARTRSVPELRPLGCPRGRVARGAARRGGSAGRHRGDRRAHRCRQGRRQGRLLYYDRSRSRGEDRQDIRGDLSRYRGAGRAQRRRADLPAHRPGARQQNLRRRHPRIVGHRAVHRVEASRLAYALRAARGRREMAERSARSRWVFRQRALHPLADRLQYQAGEGGRRADQLRRSPRQEMDRQDRQGASRL